MKILLGSNSPRRRELLAGLDVDFDVVKLETDESYPDDLQAGDIALHIARAKAEAFRLQDNPQYVPLQDSIILITADTIVWCEGQMLGKPKDEVDAQHMLRLLSGRTHQVYTGVVMRKFQGKDSLIPIRGEDSRDAVSKDLSGALHVSRGLKPMVQTIDFVVRTDVTFREITDDEIDYYITHYRPFDKAGAYGIQEWIGYIACTRLDGSYFNVMGFPVQRVNEALKQLM